MPEKRRTVGRPRKEKQVRDFPVMAYMPDAEAYEAVRRAAELHGDSVSAWARNVLLSEAQRVLGGSSAHK